MSVLAQYANRFLRLQNTALRHKAAPKKSSKDEAKYVSKAPSADVRCDRCTMWRAPSSCTAVEGAISPGAHCRYFEAK